MVENPVPTNTSSVQNEQENTDACKYHKLLEESDRAATYSDLSSYRCDMQLSGWYRFSGKAGNKMLSSCPVGMSTKMNRCGSYYQGWLQPRNQPAISEGEVSGTVCFSPPDSCQCSHSKQIKLRNCGKYLVYFFDGVPKCNSRYCGTKGVHQILFYAKYFKLIASITATTLVYIYKNCL